MWLSAVLVLGLLAACAGLLLTFVARRFAPAAVPLVDRIDALLPQTQCAQCGHPGCRPYAEAIAGGGPIDRCPPGGAALVAALADLLARQPPAATPFAAEPERLLARIDESHCIGCALCLPACPVDAIVGAPHYLHTVLAEHCTGCGLCLPPCPVDCIRLEPAAALPAFVPAPSR